MRGQTNLKKMCYHCGRTVIRLGSKDTIYICKSCKNQYTREVLSKQEKIRRKREKKLKRILD